MQKWWRRPDSNKAQTLFMNISALRFTSIKFWARLRDFTHFKLTEALFYKYSLILHINKDRSDLY